MKTLLFCLLLACGWHVQAQGYLHAEGEQLVDGQGKPVLLRGMGLGGWMLQEGYMFQLSALGQQYRIREKIAATTSEAYAKYFYDEWLKRHVTEADVAFMKQAGFNSIRLPMHFGLFTLPVEKEPAEGHQTWLPQGFALTDSLLAWCRKHEMYLILDMHASPGGQGYDLPISDRNAALPSLWDSKANQDKLVALWTRLASRYANERWIGGYDLLNEPNWSFTDKTDERGINEEDNSILRDLFMRLTKAVRSVDTHHLLIIEGNGFGNNYKKLLPPWEPNMALSFHKYGNYNDEASIKGFLELRERYHVPLWMGESGENSNTWFTEAIRLAETHNIGWAWWQEKKMGINNPLEIKTPTGYDALIKAWTGKGPALPAAEAKQVLDQLLENIKIENNIIHADVVDAMFRQVYSKETRPFKKHRINGRTEIPAVEYDLGAQGAAYWDVDSARYQYTAGNKSQGNKGWQVRNDGVDISQDSNGAYIFDFQPGEWLCYTVEATPGQYSMSLMCAGPAEFEWSDASGWKQTIWLNSKLATPGWTDTVTIPISSSPTRFKLKAVSGNARLYKIALQPYVQH